MVANTAQNASSVHRTADEIQRDLDTKLARLRAAVEQDPYPDLTLRKDRLRRAVDAILTNEQRLIDALKADFGQRSEVACLGDLMYPVSALRYALRHVERWMRVEKRTPDFPMNLLGARTYIFYQPIGVVGIIAPWNLPVGLAYAPLAGALAAGNRAMIKPSELTPRTSALIADITAKAFSLDEVTVVQGGIDVSSRFSALPFDHMIFTGSAPVARKVMRAASDHLTPVTLELGGKSPVIIAKGADLNDAAKRVVTVKLNNAGQICMGVDHVLVHRSDRDAFVSALKQKLAECYPDFANNPDACHVFLTNQRQRLARLVEDAARHGAKIEIPTGSTIEQLALDPKFPLTLIIDPPPDCAVMREEIFGPVLPICSYDSLEEVARQVRSGERPLALYFLGGNKEEQEYLLRSTWAGGVTFDDIMLHPLMSDLPFGGVGNSGMGRYCGQDGFKTFSNVKAVAHKPWFDVVNMTPPHTSKLITMMRFVLRKG